MRRLCVMVGTLVLLVVSPAMAQTDVLNCDDLSEAEEQAVFAADPSDPNQLDGNDNDGKPCEEDTTDNGSYSPTNNSGASESQYDNGNEPGKGVMPGTIPGKKLPKTGGVPLALPLGAMLVAGGLIGAGIIRRR